MQRTTRRFTSRTIAAAVFALAGFVLIGITADQIQASDLSGKTVLVPVLLVLAFSSVAFATSVFWPRRSTGYVFLIIGASAIVVSIAILATIPRASASAIPALSTWLSVLIPGVLIVLAGLAVLLEAGSPSRRSKTVQWPPQC